MISLTNRENTLIGNDLKNFIIQIANSSLKTEILEFIYYNPKRLLDSSLLARGLERKEEQIKKALSDFVEAKVLDHMKNIHGTYYIPVKNSEVLELLNKFIKLFNSQGGRGIICSIIINSGNNNYYRKNFETVKLNFT